MPADRWLDDRDNELKWAIVARIEELGYVPEIFSDPTGRRSLAGSEPWSASAVDRVVRACQGMAIIGLPRWTFDDDGDRIALPSEFAHYEGALARTLGLPTLVVVGQNVLHRVVFDSSFGHIAYIPEATDSSWLAARDFTVAFGYWRDRLAIRRDIFLGYCGQSSVVAAELRGHLERDLGLTVLDWQRDFTPGRSILHEIEEASSRCSAGIFLFTKDDEMTATGAGGAQALPRDNVVFEAGYFSSAKGKDRVLVVLEAGTKMPADLGGDIYASLDDRTSIDSVTTAVARFVGSL